MTAEASVQSAIRLALGKAAQHVRLFRNNRGKAWAGRVVSDARHPVSGARIVTIEHAQPVEFGLVNGASDLIGWSTVTVTPDMVGRKLAVFTAQEVKNERRAPTEEQERFIRNVLAAGGIAGVVRSPEDALRLVAAP